MVENNDIDLEKQDENEEIVARINKKISEGKTHLGDARKEQKEAYDYYAGNQWTDEDRRILDEQKRPAIVFNRIPRIVNAVCGLEVQNRQEVSFIPRTLEDQGFNDFLNSAVKWVRDSCDAEDEDSETFRDAIICGYGWSEVRMDYDINPDGDIKIERIDPLDMIYDPCASKKNLVDAKWIAQIKKMTKREVKALWPEADFTASSSSFNDEGEFQSDTGEDRYEGPSDHGHNSKKMDVIKYQEFETVTYYRVANPMTGEIEELSKEAHEKLQVMPEFEHMNVVRLKKRIYKQFYIAGKTLLESSELPCQDFTFACTTGLYDRNNNTYFGLVKLMIDPQMWHNKWLSQILHIINSNAKGGAFFEQGAFANPRKARQDWAKPDALIELTPGALSGGKVQPKQAPAYPDGVDRLMQYAQSAINDVSGVSLEFLGLSDRDQPYALEYQRQKQGTLILAPFFDSLRRYRKLQGRLLYKYVRDFISDGRLVRIFGQDGAKYVPLVREKMAFEYDVVVSDAPSSPNVKERVFEVLNKIIPIALNAGIPIPPDVLEYAPIPESLVMKWKEEIQRNQPDPEQMEFKKQLQHLQLVLAQMEAQNLNIDAIKKAADAQKVDSEILLNQAKAQQAASIGQDEQAQAAQKMGLIHQENQNKSQQMMIEQARKDVEMMLNHYRKVEELKLKKPVV